MFNDILILPPAHSGNNAQFNHMPAAWFLRGHGSASGMAQIEEAAAQCTH